MIPIEKKRISDEKMGGCGFTLIELLVVISIISLLMGILVPTLGLIRRQAKAVLGVCNQGQITNAISFFSSDNDDRYPESVATIGTGSNWHWQDPRMVVGYLKRTPKSQRAISEYIGSYIEEAKTMVCPLAPLEYKYLHQAWKAGNNWDNPETAPVPDPFIGSYCFYWNYVAYRGNNSPPFIGPRSPFTSGKAESTLLTSCYFGFNHWRSPAEVGSCEKLPESEIVAETFISSAYWSTQATAGEDRPVIKLHAGYTDGHVESFLSSETFPIKVALTPDGSTAYPDSVGPGSFFLPDNCVR